MKWRKRNRYREKASVPIPPGSCRWLAKTHTGGRRELGQQIWLATEKVVASLGAKQVIIRHNITPHAWSGFEKSSCLEAENTFLEQQDYSLITSPGKGNRRRQEHRSPPGSFAQRTGLGILVHFQKEALSLGY